MDQKKRKKREAPGNPTGKGGFGDHPEHINSSGAPRKGASMGEVIKAGMEELVEIEVERNGRKVKIEIPRKLALFERMFRDAMRGDSPARRDLLHYHDGLPQQSVTQHIPGLERYMDALREADEMQAADDEALKYVQATIKESGGNGNGNGSGRNG